MQQIVIYPFVQGGGDVGLLKVIKYGSSLYSGLLVVKLVDK
jgi:hypothetical protein